MQKSQLQVELRPAAESDRLLQISAEKFRNRSEHKMSVLESISRQDLIIILVVIIVIFLLLVTIITILGVYCCRKQSRSRGKVYSELSLSRDRSKLAIFLVEWYSVDKHALITLDSETNVKGSVDLDFIMKVYK